MNLPDDDALIIVQDVAVIEAWLDELIAADVPQHDRLTTSEVAVLCGWQPRTVAQNVSRGRMPAPSGHFGRTPWWDRAVIVAWLEQRPGRGVGGGRPRKDTT